MKKFICLLLGLAMCCSFAACGDIGGSTAESLNFHSTQTVEGMVEYTVTHAFTTQDVMPPILSGVYSHFPAGTGNTYIVVVMKVKHLGNTQVSVDTLMTPTLKVGGNAYPYKGLIVADRGTSFNYPGITGISPLETMELYHAFQVPEGTPTEDLTLALQIGKKTYEGKLSLSEFAAAPVQQNVPFGDAVSLTLEDMYFTQELRPANPEGSYRYFTAEEGSTYLVLQCTVTNNGNDIACDEIAGVSCLYDGKYRYTGKAVAEEQDGSDFAYSAGNETLKALQSRRLYFLFEVPTQVENGPIILSFYLNGSYYTCQMP